MQIIPEGDGQRRKQLLRVAVAVLQLRQQDLHAQTVKQQVIQTQPQAGRHPVHVSDLEIEYRPHFGVEYLMRQFFAHPQRLFRRMEGVCGYHPRGRLFEHLLLSITHDGAQHIVAGD
ncbi:hypothetical protein ECZU26_46150 [Escherichia coli]|nr:hypothetical protein ECZU26_46150 [Escherichia coli]